MNTKIVPCIDWHNFDADKPDPKMAAELARVIETIKHAEGLNDSDEDAIRVFATGKIGAYDSGACSELNETVGISIFRPNEFCFQTLNDQSLRILAHWLKDAKFDWRKGSRNVQAALRNDFPSAGPVRFSGGREYVELDNLCVIDNRKVAIEIETSNNLDNGYWTLRQAIRKKKADYGVMIVPWIAKRQGRADEGKALGKLDREFEGATNLQDGPIYRIAIVRKLDIYMMMLRP